MRPEPFYDAGGINSLIKSPPFWPASKNPPVGDFTDFPVQRKQPHSASLPPSQIRRWYCGSDVTVSGVVGLLFRGRKRYIVSLPF